MPTLPLHLPLLPSHYSLWFDPPDEAGDEALHIVSERRAIKLKGRAFREFRQHVVPLLDGQHTLEQIVAATADEFRAEDLLECLTLLHAQGLIVEGARPELSGDAARRRQPQLNLFHDLAPDAPLQANLAQATVAVIGLGGAGATAALALAAAGVGTLRLADAALWSTTDGYLAPFLADALADAPAGVSRAQAVAARLRAAAGDVQVLVDEGPLQSEDDLRRAVAGAGYVVCCLDGAQANLAYKLNRVCLAASLPWITCALGGAEVAIGPAFRPGDGPCYMCWRMRLIACAGNPEDAFAHERWLDHRKQDDGGRRENLVFGAGLAGNLLALEVTKVLTGLAEPSLEGRLLTVRLTDLAIERHTVLRKPWCPACAPPTATETARVD
jgi:molybdopterin-synthase adenylyltransferase